MKTAVVCGKLGVNHQFTFWILVAATARWLVIDRDSFWIDEAISYLTAKLPLPMILENIVQSSHPPLYYLNLHLWLLWFPDNETGVRLLSLFWGLALLPAIYWLTLDLLGDKQAALFSVGIVTLSPFHVFFSNEARMYTLHPFLVVVACWAYLRACQQSQSGWWWVLFVIMATAAIYTHLFTFFVLVGIGCYALIKRQERRNLWLTILSGAVIALAFVPWLWILWGEMQADIGSMRPLAADAALATLEPLKLLKAVAFLLFGLFHGLIYVLLAFFFALALLVVTLLELRKARLEKTAEAVLFPALMVGAIVGLPTALYYLQPFFLPERSLAAAMPFLAILLSWGVSRRGSPLPYLAYGALALMAMGTSLYLLGGEVKDPYRTATEIIEANRQPNDLILHTSEFSYMPMLIYLARGENVLLAGTPNPIKPAEVHRQFGGDVWSQAQVQQSGGRIWLVVALVDNLEWQQKQADYFAASYTQLERHQVGGVEIFLYAIRP